MRTAARARGGLEATAGVTEEARQPTVGSRATAGASTRHRVGGALPAAQSTCSSRSPSWPPRGCRPPRSTRWRQAASRAPLPAVRCARPPLPPRRCRGPPSPSPPPRRPPTRPSPAPRTGPRRQWFRRPPAPTRPRGGWAPPPSPQGGCWTSARRRWGRRRWRGWRGGRRRRPGTPPRRLGRRGGGPQLHVAAGGWYSSPADRLVAVRAALPLPPAITGVGLFPRCDLLYAWRVTAGEPTRLNRLRLPVLGRRGTGRIRAAVGAPLRGGNAAGSGARHGGGGDRRGGRGGGGRR